MIPLTISRRAIIQKVRGSHSPIDFSILMTSTTFQLPSFIGFLIIHTFPSRYLYTISRYNFIALIDHSIVFKQCFTCIVLLFLYFLPILYRTVYLLWLTITLTINLAHRNVVGGSSHSNTSWK